MITDIVADVLAVLDTDDAALTSQAADIQAQIDALNVQLALVRQRQADSARFRQLAQSIQDGSAYSSVVVPGSPALDPATATPITSGITQ